MSAGVLISVVTAGVSTITFLQWPNAVLNPIFELGIPFLRDGYVVHNAGHVLGLEGTWSMLPFYLIVAAVLLAMILGPRWQTTNRRLLHAATALLIAASAVSFMHSVQTSDRNVRNKFASLMHKKWRPAPGPSLDLTKQQVRSAKTPEVLLQLGNHAAMSGRSKEALKHYAKRVSLIDNTFE